MSKNTQYVFLVVLIHSFPLNDYDISDVYN